MKHNLPKININDLNRLFGDNFHISSSKQNSIKIDYILDRNNRIRWAYPSELNRPTYLNTYNSSGIKPTIYKIITNICFKLKLKNIIRDGVITIYYDSNSCYLSNLLRNNFSSRNFSIFFGTYGEDRKMIIEYNDGSSDESSGFIKIPISKKSNHLVSNEKDNLMFLNNAISQSSKLKVPNCEHLSSEVLCVKNIFNKDMKVPSYYSLKPVLSLHKLNIRNINYYEFYQNHYLKSKPSHFLPNFRGLSDIKIMKIRDTIKDIYYYLDKMKNFFPDEKIVFTSFSHRDFTPWNCRFYEDSLYVIDWERAGYSPLFFDIFHYVFQNEILINQNFCISDIRNKMLDILKLYANESININEYFILFLISHISNRVELIVESEEWFPQIEWQLNVWRDALIEIYVK